MRDIMAEVFTSMKSNKTRIALTGFSIGWGLFILIVLLGAGNGLLKGMMANFSNSTDNIFTITPGKTSMLFNGWPKNKEITLMPEDVDVLEKSFPLQIDHITSALSAPVILSYKTVQANGAIDGQELAFERTERIKIIEGRTLNQVDMDSLRKVCLISSSMSKILFRDIKNPVGQKIIIGDVPFLVIGVFEPRIDVGSVVRDVHAPYTTVQKLFCPENHISKINIMTRNLDDLSSNESFEKNLRRKIAVMKDFNVSDPSAVKIEADYENYLSTTGILRGIYLFIIIIGLATMVSGVVGVSNIMMITVKERTRELGVRKAMGASNEHIVGLVLIESVIITLIFGYAGMMAGVGVTQLLSVALGAMGGSGIFDSPTVGLSVIISANLVMLIAGLIAGYVPAKKAVSCKLVDALAA